MTKFWNWSGWQLCVIFLPTSTNTASSAIQVWYVNDFDPIIELKNNSYLTTFYSGTVPQAKLDAKFDYIWQFNVKILIERVFTLEQVPEAHRFLQSADGFGKVVVINE